MDESSTMGYGRATLCKKVEPFQNENYKVPHMGSTLIPTMQNPSMDAPSTMEGAPYDPVSF